MVGDILLEFCPLCSLVLNLVLGDRTNAFPIFRDVRYHRNCGEDIVRICLSLMSSLAKF
jgi:hypothetical protein